MISATEIIPAIARQYPCCTIRSVAIAGLPAREKAFFSTFAPSAKAAIVVGHHVSRKSEWQWFADEAGGEFSTADYHTRAVCEHLVSTIAESGYSAAIVPYPGESGLQFRYVAAAAGMGEIGVNAFLLHPHWGPWLHLRVLATTVLPGDTRAAVAGICTDCGRCIAACPAGAIRSDAFYGLRCRSYRKAKGEYIPCGHRREFHYCTTCADICPVGKPQGI